MENPSPHHFRSSDPTNSPEFEFWNPGRHPHPSPPTLHSADEIFSHGFLLPLNPISHHHHPDPDPDPEPNPEPDPEPSSASILSSSGNSILTASKRWKEIFRRSEKKSSEKKEKKVTNNSQNNNITGCNSSSGSGSGSSSAELNINIWPFSRSRSAGNNASQSRPAGLSNRKVSSAPCSRSNSSGESKSRRSWPSSPGRTGVYLGRSSPVWQMPRNRTGSEGNRRVKVYGGGGAGKGRVLNLNVPMCMGYRQGLSCRSEESEGGDGGDGGGGRARSGGVSGGGSGNLFSLRGLFSKKGVVTV